MIKSKLFMLLTLQLSLLACKGRQVSDLKQVAVELQHEGSVIGLAISADEQRIAVAHAKNYVELLSDNFVTFRELTPLS